LISSDFLLLQQRASIDKGIGPKRFHTHVETDEEMEKVGGQVSRVLAATAKVL